MSNDFNHITLLVDIDDTIENLVDAWCKWLNEKHGLDVQPEDITDWDIHQFFPELTQEQVFEPMFVPDFWKTVAPKEDAITYLQKLQDEGFQVYLCTDTNYRSIYPKVEYLLKPYFPFIDWHHVIISHNKQMVKCDCRVDDAPHNLEGADSLNILFTAPHNHSYDVDSNKMRRMNNWEDVYEIIHSTFGA